jgi:hypothetical protein
MIKSNSYHAKRPHKQPLRPAPRQRRPAWVAAERTKRLIVDMEQFLNVMQGFGATTAQTTANTAQGSATNA